MKHISQMLEISEQAVYKSKKDGALDTYVKICRSITETIDDEIIKMNLDKK